MGVCSPGVMMTPTAVGVALAGASATPSATPGQGQKGAGTHDEQQAMHSGPPISFISDKIKNGLLRKKKAARERKGDVRGA